MDEKERLLAAGMLIELLCVITANTNYNEGMKYRLVKEYLHRYANLVFVQATDSPSAEKHGCAN